MAASRETLARTIEPSTLKRKFEELEEVLEGVSTTGVLTDASTWKFTRYRNEDGTPRLLESEELKVGLSTSAPDKELRAEIMRIVGVLVAAFEKHADEYERIIQDRMSKRRKVGEKQTGDGDHL